MTDQEIIDGAAEENKRERVAAQEALHDAIIDVIPKDMTTADAVGVFIELFAEAIIQAHPRVKQDALDAAARLGEKMPSFVERAWGKPLHQSFLGSRSREVN